MKTKCTFTLCGSKWECVRKKMTGNEGGYCDARKNLIEIDRSQKPDSFRSFLLHELMEGVAMLTGVAYTRECPDETTIFVMDHKEMSMAMDNIRSAYDEVVKKIGAHD